MQQSNTTTMTKLSSMILIVALVIT